MLAHLLSFPIFGFIHVVLWILQHEPIRQLPRMRNQRIIIRLAQYEHILDMQLQFDLRQLLAQLANPKRHICDLFLRQEPRVLRLFRMFGRVFVHMLFLCQAFVRQLILGGDLSVVFKERVDYAICVSTFSSGDER